MEERERDQRERSDGRQCRRWGARRRRRPHPQKERGDKGSEQLEKGKEREGCRNVGEGGREEEGGVGEGGKERTESVGG